MKPTMLFTLLAATCLTASTASAKPIPNESPLQTFDTCSEVRDMFADEYSMQIAYSFAYPSYNNAYGPRPSTADGSSAPSTGAFAPKEAPRGRPATRRPTSRSRASMRTTPSRRMGSTCTPWQTARSSS